MSLLSDFSGAHRDLADMWDEARVDLESNPEPLERVSYRFMWLGSWAGLNVVSFLVGGVIGLMGSLGQNLVANIMAIAFVITFNALWVSVWIRSYLLKEDDIVDLTK